MNQNQKNLTSFQLRLKHDFDQIRRLKQQYLAITIPNDQNPFNAIANIKLEEGPYSNLILHLNIEIPKNYPFFPPKIFINKAQGFNFNHNKYLKQEIYQPFSKNNIQNKKDYEELIQVQLEILEVKQWLTSYTLLSVLTQIKLAFENPNIINHSQQLSEGDLQLLIMQSKNFTSQIQRNYNQILVHSFENPFPPFINPENQEDQLNLHLTLPCSPSLTCSILKHNIKNSNDQFILGFPINFDENNKPVLKVLYQEPTSYQAYIELKLHFDNNELEECLRSGQGHAINSWFPLYLSEKHFQNSLKQLKYFISSMHFSNAFSEQNILKKFSQDQFINVFPILLEQLLIKKNDEQALQAFFQVLRLFLKLINFYPTIQNQIDAEIAEILDINENQSKKQKQYNKFKFNNISELIMMLGLSSNGIDDYEIWNLIVDEFLARHIAEIIKNNSKSTSNFCIINYTKEEFFNAVKEELNDIIYYFCIIRYCTQNKQQFCSEIDKNGGIILNIQDIFNDIDYKINEQVSDFNKLYEFLGISDEPQNLQKVKKLQNEPPQLKDAQAQNEQKILENDQNNEEELETEEVEENEICFAIKTAFQYEYLNIAFQPFFNKNIDIKVLTQNKSLEETQKNLLQHLEIYETIFFEELEKQNISIRKCQSAADTIIDFFIYLVEINKNINEIEFPVNLNEFQKLLYQCAISSNHSIKKTDLQDFFQDFLAEQMAEQIEKKPDLIQVIANKLLSSSHFFKMIKDNLLQYSKYVLFIQVFVNQKINKKVIKEYKSQESQNNSCTVTQKAIEEYQELLIQLQIQNNTFEELFEFLEIPNYQKKLQQQIIEILFNYMIEEEFLDTSMLEQQKIINIEHISINNNNNIDNDQLIQQKSEQTYQEKEKIYHLFIDQNIQFLFDLTKELADLDCITEVTVQQYCCEIQFIFQKVFKQYPFLPQFIVDETNNLLAEDEYALRNKQNLKSIGQFINLFYITKYLEKSNNSELINEKEFNVQYKKKLMVILKEFCARQVKSAIQKNFVEDKEYQDELSRKNKHQEVATNFYNQMSKQNKMISLNLIMAQNFIAKEYVESIRTVEEILNFAGGEFQEQCDFIRKQMNGFETFFQCIGIYISMPETFINLFLKEVFELSVRQGYNQEIIETYQQYMPKAKNNEIFNVLLNNTENNENDLYLQLQNKKKFILNQ